MLQTYPVRKRNGGFTIVEAVIAMAVIAVGMLAMYIAMSRALLLSDTNKQVKLASFRSQQIAERIMRTPFNNIMSVFPAGVPNTLNGAAALPNERIMLTYSQLAGGGVTDLPASFTGDTPQPLYVTITVTWDNPTGVRDGAGNVIQMRYVLMVVRSLSS